MNRIFRLKFDRSSQQLIVVSELATNCAAEITDKIQSTGLANILEYDSAAIEALSYNSNIVNVDSLAVKSQRYFEMSLLSNVTLVTSALTTATIPFSTNEEIVASSGYLNKSLFLKNLGLSHYATQVQQLVELCSRLLTILPELNQISLDLVGHLVSATSFFAFKNQESDQKDAYLGSWEQHPALATAIVTISKLDSSLLQVLVADLTQLQELFVTLEKKCQEVTKQQDIVISKTNDKVTKVKAFNNGGYSKLTTSLRKVLHTGMALSIASFAMLLSTAQAVGNAQVVAGSADIKTNGYLTTITTQTDKTIINWDSFNIQTNEIVDFVQKNAHSSVLNRVLGDQVSQILGQLKSNGQIFLINPNGIVFGKGAIVDTQGVIASTLNIADADYLQDKLNFTAKEQAIASILNQGLISVGKDGSLALIGGKVTNQGVLKAENGDILLLAGQEIQISDFHNPHISYKVNSGNSVINLSKVFTGGNVKILAHQVINNGDIVAGQTQEVGSVAQAKINNGVVELIAVGTNSNSNSNLEDKDVNNVASDTISTTRLQTATKLATESFVGTTGNISGHQIAILADNISLDGNTTIVAHGNATAGGQIIVGGQTVTQRLADNSAPLVTANYQALTPGQELGSSAKTLYINKDVNLRATASQKQLSAGEKQVSEQQLDVSSKQSRSLNESSAINTIPVISLYGRRAYYDGKYNVAGGLLETSAQSFILGKNLDINTHGGEWLLDPLDIRIINSSANLFYTLDNNKISSVTVGDLTNPTSKYTEGAAVTIADNLLSKNTVTIPDAGNSSTINTGIGNITITAPTKDFTTVTSSNANNSDDAVVTLINKNATGSNDATSVSNDNSNVAGSSVNSNDNSATYFYRLANVAKVDDKESTDNIYATRVVANGQEKGIADSDNLTSFVSDSYLTDKLKNSHITLLTNKGNITASNISVNANAGYSLRLITRAGFINLNNATINLGNGNTSELAGKTLSPVTAERYGNVGSSLLGLAARDAVIVTNSNITAGHLAIVTQGNSLIENSSIQGGLRIFNSPNALSQIAGFVHMGYAYVPQFPESYLVKNQASGVDYSLKMSNVSVTAGNGSRVLVNNSYATYLDNVSFTFDDKSTAKQAASIVTNGLSLAGNLTITNNSLVIHSQATNNKLASALSLDKNVTIDSQDNANIYLNLYGQDDSKTVASHNPSNSLITIVQDNNRNTNTESTTDTSKDTGKDTNNLATANLTIKGANNYWLLGQDKKATTNADLTAINLTVSDNSALRMRVGILAKSGDDKVTSPTIPTLSFGKINLGNSSRLVVANHQGDEALIAANRPLFNATPVNVNLVDKVQVGVNAKLNVISQGNITLGNTSVTTPVEVTVASTGSINLQAPNVNFNNVALVNKGNVNITGLVATQVTTTINKLANEQVSYSKKLTLVEEPSDLAVTFSNSTITNGGEGNTETHKHGVISLKAPLGNASLTITAPSGTSDRQPTVYGQDIAVSSFANSNLNLNGHFLDSKITSDRLALDNLNSSYSFLDSFYHNNLLQADSTYINPVSADVDKLWSEKLNTTKHQVAIQGNVTLQESEFTINALDNVYLGFKQQNASTDGKEVFILADTNIQLQDSDILLTTSGRMTDNSPANGLIALGNIKITTAEQSVTNLEVTHQHKGGNNLTLDAATTTVAETGKVDLNISNLNLKAQESYLSGDINLKSNLTSTGNLTLVNAGVTAGNTTVAGDLDLLDDSQLKVKHNLSATNVIANYSSVVAQELQAKTVALTNNATIVVTDKLQAQDVLVSGSLLSATNVQATNLSAVNSSIGVNKSLTLDNLVLNNSIVGAVYGTITVNNSTSLSNNSVVEAKETSLQTEVALDSSRLASANLTIKGNVTAANTTVVGNNLTISGIVTTLPGEATESSSSEATTGSSSGTTDSTQAVRNKVTLDQSSFTLKNQANLVASNITLNGTASKILAPSVAIDVDNLSVTNSTDVALGGDKVTITAHTVNLANDVNIKSRQKLTVSCSAATNIDCNKTDSELDVATLARLQSLFDSFMNQDMFSAVGTGLSGSNKSDDGDGEDSKDEGSKSEESQSSTEASAPTDLATGTTSTVSSSGSTTSSPKPATSPTTPATSSPKPVDTVVTPTPVLVPKAVTSVGNVGSRNQNLREELRSRNNITPVVTQTTSLPKTTQTVTNQATTPKLVGVDTIINKGIQQPSVATIKALQQQGISSNALPYGASDKQFAKVEQVDIQSIFNKMKTGVADSVEAINNKVKDQAPQREVVTVQVPTNIFTSQDDKKALASIAQQLKQAQDNGVVKNDVAKGNVDLGDDSVQIIVRQATPREISILNSTRNKGAFEMLASSVDPDSCTSGGSSGVAICKVTSQKVITSANGGVSSSSNEGVQPVVVNGSSVAPYVNNGVTVVSPKGNAISKSSRLPNQQLTLNQFTKSASNGHLKRLVTADGKVVYLPETNKKPSFRTKLQIGTTLEQPVSKNSK